MTATIQQVSSVVRLCGVCKDTHQPFEVSCDGCGAMHGKPVMDSRKRIVIDRTGRSVLATVIHGRGLRRSQESPDSRNVNPASAWRVAAFCEACRREMVGLAKEKGEYIPFFSRSQAEKFVAERNERNRLAAEERRARDVRLARFVNFFRCNGRKKESG